MRKIFITLSLVAAVSLFQYCSSSKKAAAATTSAVTYEGNLKPIIVADCGPCHIEGKGKVKPLDNYSNASGEVDEMIARIQKNPGDHGFMPAMHPKLSDSSIAVFVDWKNGGLKEK